MALIISKPSGAAAHHVDQVKCGGFTAASRDGVFKPPPPQCYMFDAAYTVNCAILFGVVVCDQLKQEKLLFFCLIYRKSNNLN